jgi:3-dehydroquinate synthase
MKQIDIQLSHSSYPIYIDANLTSRLAELIPQTLHGQKTIIVTDHNVGALYADIVKASCANIFSSIDVIAVDNGEASKSFAVYTKLCEDILSRGITRNTTLIALGGGVIGDLTGFVAASLLRGIPFIQIPTTLLAQVDSSVGGKTGINSEHGKNLIGAFYQPNCVIINTDWLKTLPVRELRAGYAEVIKYGLLGDKDFYNHLIQNGHRIFEYDQEVLTNAIYRSCTMKADIVTRDEKETNGLRALLNLGHTFAHPIETLCHYDGRVLHGEAVAIGLVAALELSRRLGYIEKSDIDTLEAHLKSLGFMTRISDVPNISKNIDEYIALMRKDKKATNTGMVFVVNKQIGKAEIQSGIDKTIIQEVIKCLI